MHRFYRAMRKRSGLLMENGKPTGGKFSYDQENRKPYRSQIPVSVRPRYAPDELTAEVLELVAKQVPAHFGSLDGFDLPVTINRMSDYCKGCKFDPARSTGDGSCPFTALYWSFLERNRDRLSSNQRLAMPYATLHKKTAGERKALRAGAAAAVDELASVPRPEYQATGTENR